MKQSELRKIIREEIQSILNENSKDLIKENFVDRFFDHLDVVLKKGRVKQVYKDVSKERPDLAKAVADYDNAQKRIGKLLNNYSDKEVEQISSDFDKMIKGK